MFNKKSHRPESKVSAGSMADIAFLLLIFFLVTTTISIDKGILVKLPVWDPNPPSTAINENNVLSVKINGQNELLVEGQIEDISSLKKAAIDFIINPNKDHNKPSSPKKAIISLQNDRSTNYETYLLVYNELKAAYNEIWENRSLVEYGVSYKSLDKKTSQLIRNEVPLVISEAEPTDFVQSN